MTLEDLQTFALLKSQIISIATALYGTQATNASTGFDVITYTCPPLSYPTTIATASPTTTTSSTCKPKAKQNTTTYAIALITYTSPQSCTTWELLSHIENQESPIMAAEKMLEDLRVGMGDVMADLKARGTYTVQHATVPDLAGVGSSSGGPGGEGSSSGQAWSEDVGATDGCFEEAGTWQDFHFDVGSQATLASIKEEDE